MGTALVFAHLFCPVEEKDGSISYFDNSIANDCCCNTIELAS